MFHAMMRSYKVNKNINVSCDDAILQSYLERKCLCDEAILQSYQERKCFM